MKRARIRIAATLLAFLAAGALRADGFIVIPRPPRPGPAGPFPLQVVRHDVRVTLDGQLATTAVDQEFYNPNAERLEGFYLFPLPAGAAVRGFSMWIDGREARAELLDAAKARAVYEDIVRRLRDPALLEYSGSGVFRMRVFPIEPRGRKRIRISYHEVLEQDNGALAYRYPLATEKFSSRPIPEVSIVADVHSPSPLASVHCPSHEAEISRPAAGRATVRYAVRDALPDRDFRLIVTPTRQRLGFSLLAHRAAGQDGTFFLSIAPGFGREEREVASRDITFLVDTSGSMAGRAMEQAREAILLCLQRLRRGDRFNVVRFATEAEPLFHRPLPADAANLARAREFVSGWQAAGGTNLEEALKTAGGDPAPGGRPRVIVLVTDGRPTIGETGEEALLRLATEAQEVGLRLFPVAIGDEINTHLLDGFAERTGTFRTYLESGENIATGITRLYEKISSPVLGGLRLDISKEAGVSQTHPNRLPDLYRGAALTVAGRYRGQGRATFTLRGTVNGRDETFTFQADLPRQDLDHDFLPALWAARRVGYLLDQIRLHGEERELAEEVKRLARRHGIITPYTSYLIVEDEKARRGRGELAESDMTVTGIPGAPALERGQREEFAAMKDKSGSGSVRASVALQRLNEAATADAARPLPSAIAGGVRTAGGAAFYLNNGTWVDGRIQEKGRLPEKRVAFASPAYFSLLREHPELAQALALGRSVRLLSRGRLIEIFDPEAGG